MNPKIVRPKISTFIHLYEQGLIEEANQQLCPTPEIVYPQDTHQLIWYLTNYMDAAVWGGAVAYSHAWQALVYMCQKELDLSSLKQWIEEESRFFHFYLQDATSLIHDKTISDGMKETLLFLQAPWKEPPLEREDLTMSLPARIQPIFERKISSANALYRLLQQKPHLNSWIQEKFFSSHPWHPFTYRGALPTQNGPLYFVYPYEKMPELKDPFILVFSSYADFLQTLGIWPEAAKPCHFLYVLEIYPESQWPIPPLFLEQLDSLPLSLPLAIPYFLEWRDAFILSSKEPCRAHFDRLYSVSKRMLFTQRAHRYGRSRAIPYSMNTGLIDWHDPYRPQKPILTGIGPVPLNPIAPLVEDAALRRKPRPFSPKERIRIGHIVSQIVDGGHAPTKLLRTLTTLADRDWFSPLILSTERFCPRPLSYPSLTYQSPPSQERAKSTLELFSSLAIPTFIPPPCLTYEESLSQMIKLIEQLQIDIAIFHGPDELHTLLAVETAAPLRVLFDHGTLPSFGCFELAILSTEEAFIHSQSDLLKLRIESVPLLFCVDPKETWEKEPTPRSQLGLPQEAFIMTTISNHLDNRLSDEMCAAIGEILQRCKQAVYAPMGPVKQEARFRHKWEPYGVNDRIFFLGHTRSPSQLARSMNLYLNEFPFGSGLGLLDAMAAGCPIVSMYDPTGPQQAKYGGVYFGKEWALSSLKRSDYVDLACTLIQNPEMYREWSHHAKLQCAQRTDTKGYVAKFETILRHAIEHFRN